MRVDLTPCVILHRRAWRDTSLIVEAFSREHGRVALIAKGARRPKARWRGLLEPLAGLQLAWSGRGEMYSLTDAEPVQRHVLDGNALMAAFYASELVMRLTARDDPHPPLYDSLEALLDALGQGAPSILALRFFERDLLDEVGYGIALDTTTDTGEAVEAERAYLYHPDAGLRRASGPARADEVRIEGSALIGLVNGRFGHREDIRAARDLMRAAIAPHLGNRPLKSVQTLQAMQQFRAAGSSEPALNTSSGESP
ncbi:DNA repair protein RecO [Salinisphaera aquimarina]|uniref:DNA repair protein RecO n=1 Tax=Salinisphaera aquimarina TaxID=2094031 RepID=A0ABV7EP31_9GAMM